MKKNITSVLLATLIAFSFFPILTNSSFAQEEIKQESNYKNLEKRRSIKEFTYSNDIFVISDRWASENGYKVIDSTSENTKVYKKSKFPIAPILCSITQEDNNVHLEGWVKAPFVFRMLTLFIIPKEINLDSDALVGAVPRKIGRNSINKLMEELEQEPIY